MSSYPNPPLPAGPIPGPSRQEDSNRAGEQNDPPEPTDDNQSGLDAPLPRPKRRPKRAEVDRGLPPDKELTNLARAYLERQHKHWTQLSEAGLIPYATNKTLKKMVADFKERHRTGKVEPDEIQPFLRVVKKLGGNYNRYSCDNSSPTSIVDQLTNSLDKAKEEVRFVPWAYVFCDYSVTGLDSSRQGYSSYKAILGDENHFIETTYIDDFTRASRDELEWWRLASLSKRLRKRLIGSSDGFDLHGPTGEMMVSVYGMLSRLFIQGLREKVLRGMRGARRRGTCLGKLPNGFTRRVHRDDQGRVVLRPDGRPRHEPCHDPATRDSAIMMFELFTQGGWSSYKIMKHFNELKVDDWDGWTDSGIKDALGNPTYIGVFIWNRTRKEFDWEEKIWTKVENPHSEWEVHYDRDLAMIPIAWWRASRRKLAAMRRQSPLTGRKPSRNQISATTLFSGTLSCQSCLDNKVGDAELKLIRSTPKYQQMGCLNGISAARGCQLSSSKSTKIIEECLLGYLRDVILTETTIEGLIVKANEYLEEEARKPVVDVGPMRAEARKLDAKVRKLLNRVENQPDESLCDAYDKRIKELQRTLEPLHMQIREAERQNRKKEVKPLELAQAKTYLADLRGLLDQETPMAALAIRTLTGPIKIRQEAIPGCAHGARWIATFGPDLMRLLRELVRDKDTSDSDVLDNVKLPEPEAVELVIDKVPEYERLGPTFQKLRDNGSSVQSIATAYGKSWDFVNKSLRFADTGERPKWKAGKRTGTGAKSAKYLQIRKEVVQLRDNKKMPFSKIADKLGVAESTVRRAYDKEYEDDIREATERGETISRGRFSHLGEDTYGEIRCLLRKGMKPKEVASKVGCGARTVYRVQRAMRDANGNDQVA